MTTSWKAPRKLRTNCVQVGHHIWCPSTWIRFKVDCSSVTSSVIELCSRKGNDTGSCRALWKKHVSPGEEETFLSKLRTLTASHLEEFHKLGEAIMLRVHGVCEYEKQTDTLGYNQGECKKGDTCVFSHEENLDEDLEAIIRGVNQRYRRSSKSTNFEKKIVSCRCFVRKFNKIRYRWVP